MLHFKEYGEVRAVEKSIVKIRGLSSCMNGQKIYFMDNSLGMIMGFDKEDVLVLLLKEKGTIKAGDKAYTRLESFEVPTGDWLIGRVVNALGESEEALNYRSDSNTEFRPLFAEAPSVLERVPLDEPLETGIKILDTMIPLGKGQRQLIIGDRMTGKTTIVTDIILNQKGKNVLCIYCCIGKTKAQLARVMRLFERHGAMEYTLVVSATASSPPGQQYLAPYAAAGMGEHFMNKGRDVLVAFDDFTKHAWIYRQLSLLLGRFPGRDAYPGDIFYLHSQMIERAGKLGSERGGGSMTFLPVVDTLQGDVTGYIPSNLISMTDGQIYLNAELFSHGFKPAVDLGLSVSRVGNKVQWPAVRELSAMLRLEYVQYRELERLTKIKAGDSGEMGDKLKTGRILTELLKQDKANPVAMEEQVVLLYLHRHGKLNALTPDQVSLFKRNVRQVVEKQKPGLLKEIAMKKKMTSEIRGALEGIQA
ncbi:MAG: F0F1 ATP synthase subunit alpha [Deltaproteobacteria bacterium]|nr:F0F1 ATP synthase subunit alpha [Deltaproteobacteria bacterium]